MWKTNASNLDFQGIAQIYTLFLNKDIYLHVIMYGSWPSDIWIGIET